MHDLLSRFSRALANGEPFAFGDRVEVSFATFSSVSKAFDRLREENDEVVDTGSPTESEEEQAPLSVTSDFSSVEEDSDDDFGALALSVQLQGATTLAESEQTDLFDKSRYLDPTCISNRTSLLRTFQEPFDCSVCVVATEREEAQRMSPQSSSHSLSLDSSNNTKVRLLRYDAAHLDVTPKNVSRAKLTDSAKRHRRVSFLARVDGAIRRLSLSDTSRKQRHEIIHLAASDEESLDSASTAAASSFATPHSPRRKRRIQLTREKETVAKTPHRTKRSIDLDEALRLANDSLQRRLKRLRASEVLVMASSPHLSRALLSAMSFLQLTAALVLCLAFGSVLALAARTMFNQNALRLAVASPAMLMQAITVSYALTALDLRLVSWQTPIAFLDSDAGVDEAFGNATCNLTETVSALEQAHSWVPQTLSLMDAQLSKSLSQVAVSLNCVQTSATEWMHTRIADGNVTYSDVRTVLALPEMAISQIDATQLSGAATMTVLERRMRQYSVLQFIEVCAVLATCWVGAGLLLWHYLAARAASTRLSNTVLRAQTAMKRLVSNGEVSLDRTIITGSVAEAVARESANSKVSSKHKKTDSLGMFFAAKAAKELTRSRTIKSDSTQKDSLFDTLAESKVTYPEFRNYGGFAKRNHPLQKTKHRYALQSLESANTCSDTMMLQQEEVSDGESTDDLVIEKPLLDSVSIVADVDKSSIDTQERAASSQQRTRRRKCRDLGFASMARSVVVLHKGSAFRSALETTQQALLQAREVEGSIESLLSAARTRHSVPAVATGAANLASASPGSNTTASVTPYDEELELTDSVTSSLFAEYAELSAIGTTGNEAYWTLREGSLAYLSDSEDIDLRVMMYDMTYTSVDKSSVGSLDLTEHVRKEVVKPLQDMISDTKNTLNAELAVSACLCLSLLLALLFSTALAVRVDRFNEASKTLELRNQTWTLDRMLGTETCRQLLYQHACKRFCEENLFWVIAWRSVLIHCSFPTLQKVLKLPFEGQSVISYYGTRYNARGAPPDDATGMYTDGKPLQGGIPLATAKLLADTFLKEDAPFQVNISASARTAALAILTRDLRSAKQQLRETNSDETWASLQFTLLCDRVIDSEVRGLAQLNM
ncbi:MAG: hypothetical protein MHM6MM_003012 [Cercozoa sp. M6MM]